VEETGGQIAEVNAKGTSQYCICGNKVKKSLAVRMHKCSKCGIEIDRDIMSAKIIKAIAFNNYKVNIPKQRNIGNTIGHTEFQACEVFPLGETMKQEPQAFNRGSSIL
jgi:putative transposase